MTSIVFDPAAVRLHRRRAASTVAAVRPILDEVADRLLDRLDDTVRRFSRALDLGGRGAVAPRLRARGIDTTSLDFGPGASVQGEAEWLPFAPASFDLVVANLSLHWANDLPGALIQLRTVLAPDGLLLATMPVLGTLAELRTALTEADDALNAGASPRVSPFPTLADCASLLQRAGFTLPVVDADSLTLLYPDPMGLLRDLRAAGETNAVHLRTRRPASQALFALALSRLALPDGRCGTTLRLGMMTGWAPAPSQPQPARRGSGQISLTEVFRA